MNEKNKKTVKGKIDGLEVSVYEGTTILEAAKSVGIEIPHFCYHPGIGIEGSCRMCLVEIKGNPKLQISCAVPFTEGIEVITDSKEVIKARNGVLEFLLINHPLDCPICDKGGECPLQDYSFKYGKCVSRYDLEKRKLVKHKILSDHIIFDAERCILCSRCARFYREVIGTHELVIDKRGHTAEISTFMDKPLANDFSGNLADICPVGALTTRDFRFQARPWELKTFDSVCGICGLNCTAQIWKKTREGHKEIKRITPANNPKVNDWWLCDRGRFGWQDLINEKRIETPLIKEGHSFREIEYSEAKMEFSEILEDLFKKTGKESFKILSSSDITNEEAWVLKKIADTCERRGSVVFDIGKISNEFHKFLAENSLRTNDFEDVKASKNLVFLGTNLVDTHPVVYLHVRKMGSAGAKIYGTHDFEFADNKLVTKITSGSPDNRKEELKKLKSELKSASVKDVTVFAEGNWISKENVDYVKDFIRDLKRDGIVRNVVVLKKNDFNTAGILDLASSYFGYAEEIDSILSGGAAKELLLIGDDLIDKFVNDSKFDPKNYNFICMVKKFSDDNMKHAHLVFPQRSFLEKNGTLTNVFGTVQKIKKAWKVLKENIEEWKVLAGLSKFLGKELDYLDEAEIYKEIGGFNDRYPSEFTKIEGAAQVYTHYDRELRK